MIDSFPLISRDDEIERKLSFPFNTHMSHELSIEEFFSRFYLPPPVYVSSGTLEDASQFIGQAGTKTAIVGAMGAGKSTYLAHEFRRILKEKGRKAAVWFDFQYLAEHESELEKLISLNEDVVVFIDSVDESVLESMRARFDKTLEKVLRIRTLIIACRAPFFADLFQSRHRSKLSHIIQLAPYEVGAQEKLIDHLVAALTTPNGREDASARAREIALYCRQAAKVGDELSATPLMSALCALAGCSDIDPRKLSGVTEVYRSFTRALADRKFRSKSDVEPLEYLAGIAWFLEERRRAGARVFIDDLSQLLGQIDLRDILLFEHEFGRSTVKGFRHRTIAEFLIAYHVVSCIDKSIDTESITNTLSSLFNYEITYFIRNLIQKLDRDVLNQLRSYVTEHLRSDDEREICSCHNCLYLIAACDKDAAPFLSTIVEDAVRAPDTIHPLIYGTLLSGLMTQGDDDNSLKMMTILDGSDVLKSRNLNYHLFYYNDTDVASIEALLNPIRAGRSWDRTRRVLIDRLTSLDEKRRSFRAYDLMTLRHFLEATDYTPNADEVAELEAIEAQVFSAKQRKRSPGAIVAARGVEVVAVGHG